MVLEGVYIFLVGFIFSITPILSDRVSGNTRGLWLWVLDDLAILDVVSLDFAQVATGADELSHDRKFLRGVDSLSLAIKVGNAETIRVKVACLS
jgi:hypothetical protein